MGRECVHVVARAGRDKEEDERKTEPGVGNGERKNTRQGNVQGESVACFLSGPQTTAQGLFSRDAKKY